LRNYKIEVCNIPLTDHVYGEIIVRPRLCS